MSAAATSTTAPRRAWGCLELGVCNAKSTPCPTCADAAYQQAAINKAVAREVRALAEPTRFSTWEAVVDYAIVITATAATVAVVLGGAGYLFGRLTA